MTTNENAEYLAALRDGVAMDYKAPNAKPQPK